MFQLLMIVLAYKIGFAQQIQSLWHVKFGDASHHSKHGAPAGWPFQDIIAFVPDAVPGAEALVPETLQKPRTGIHQHGSLRNHWPYGFLSGKVGIAAGVGFCHELDVKSGILPQKISIGIADAIILILYAVLVNGCNARVLVPLLPILEFMLGYPFSFMIQFDSAVTLLGGSTHETEQTFCFHALMQIPQHAHARQGPAPHKKSKHIVMM